MILELGDWVFDVDMPTNMTHSATQANDHCDCGYCRNFYASVDGAYPALRSFLTRFGLNVEGPDELCPFEPTIYEVTYVVNGSVLARGTQEIYVGDAPVTVQASAEADLETERPLPYFTLCIGLLELPWLLDEPMEDVVSPANEPEYLERMWNKLLRRAGEDSVSS